MLQPVGVIIYRLPGCGARVAMTINPRWRSGRQTADDSLASFDSVADLLRIKVSENQRRYQQQPKQGHVRRPTRSLKAFVARLTIAAINTALNKKPNQVASAMV